MPLYKAWDAKRETRKAVAAGSFEELAKAGELFCCLISEIQSDMNSECLQRGWGVRFSNKNWEGEYNFYLQIFLGDSVLEYYTFWKSTPPLPTGT